MTSKIIKHFMQLCLLAHIVIMLTHMATLGVASLIIICMDVVILRLVWELEHADKQ